MCCVSDLFVSLLIPPAAVKKGGELHDVLAHGDFTASISDGSLVKLQYDCSFQAEEQ